MSNIRSKNIVSISSEFGLSPLISSILYDRGFSDLNLVSEYLGYSSKTFDPLSVKGVIPAVKRIKQALDSGERILVYGDYDVDGMTSAAILYSYLSQYNQDRSVIDYFVPDRMKDGYGLTEKGIKRLAEKGFEGLVVTVDNGVSTYYEVELAKSIGRFDVIITDHHDIPTDKPIPDTWFVNPKQEGIFPEMSGAGVAHMVCSAMEKLWPTPLGCNWLADLVAIGTVADMCPLIGVNRPLVKYGLHILNSEIRTGIYELLRVCGHDFSNSVNSDTIGFKIGPCLNAAGRIDNPTQCVELLITKDSKLAEDISWNLYELNEKRKEVSRNTDKEADRIAEEIIKKNPDGGVLIISSKDFHPGIVGLAANKLVEKYNAPVLMLHETESGELKGSARTTLDFDIREGLSKSADILGRWGGHSGAAGLSVSQENLETLQKRLNEQFLSKRKKEDIRRHRYDAEISLRNISYGLISELEIFEPTGMSNPPVYFRTTNLWNSFDKLVGKAAKEHLQVKLMEVNLEMKGIMFFAPHLYPLPKNLPLTVCYKPIINEFPKGRKNLEMMIREIFW